MFRGSFETYELGGVPRSSRWQGVRDRFIQGKVCAICGGNKLLTVHHILPFHTHPELELDMSNLIVLCEGNPSQNCHLQFGHFNNFSTKWNPNIIKEAEIWKKRFLSKTMIEIR
jgi:5-methylcytosine-specific restriction protein A